MKSKVTWKRIGSMFLAVCMIITMVPMTVFAAVDEEFTVEGLKYKVLTEDADTNTGTVILTGYEGELTGELTVTESVYSTTGSAITYTVTKIGEGAFEGTDITSVSIPASVEDVGQEAFAQCHSLTEFIVNDGNTEFSAENGVLYDKDKSTLIRYPLGKSLTGFTFPDTVKTIGSYAFAYMGGVAESLTIGDNVETIEEYAFLGCEQLGEITIGSGVESIGDYAFSQCSNLKKVTFAPGSSLENIGKVAFSNCIFTEFSIPESVTTIGGGAFDYCNDLKEISISKNIVSLGDVPFYVNHALESIDVDKDNAKYSSKDGVLYNKSGDTLLRYPANKSSVEFTIPNGVTKLGESSFYANNELKELIIPSTVSTIEDSVFYWAKALEEIRFLGTNPPAIGEDFTFSQMTKLANIYVPSGTVEAYKSALGTVLSNAGIGTDIVKEYTIPGATEVTTAEGLKTALVATAAKTIWVKEDITMGEDINVGADHILIIEDGKTVSTGTTQFTIPTEKTLTVKGPGTLKADISSLQTISVVIRGTLKLTENAVLKTEKFGDLWVAGGKIDSVDSDIKILNDAGDGALGEIIQMSNDGSFSIKGGTLTIDIKGEYGHGIQGGKLDLESCQVYIKAEGGTKGIGSVIEAKNSTINVENSGSDSRGIIVYTDTNPNTFTDTEINIKNSAGTGIYNQDSDVAFNSSTINIENTGGIGLQLEYGNIISDDNTKITINNTGGTGSSLGSEGSKFQGGSFDLKEGGTLVNAYGKFKDREIVLTTFNKITIGPEAAFPSDDSLSEGEYIWNETDKIYEKAGTVDWGRDITRDFKDPAFLEVIRYILNKEENEPIFENELKKISSLHISNLGINSLDGIEYFENLEYLDCSNNKLTELNLSSLTNLISLDCGNNQLNALDVSGLTSLQYLFCENNKLERLDLSSLNKLVQVNCFYNYITGDDDLKLPSGILLQNVDSEPQFNKAYGLIVGDAVVDDTNASAISGTNIAGTVSYDKDTKTLTLDNAKVANDIDSYLYSGIISKEDITINLAGNSTVGAYKRINIDLYNTRYGIFAPNKTIIIKGTGNLTVYDQLMGIVGENVTFNSTGTISIKEKGGGGACAIKADGGILTINSGNFNLSSAESNGLYGDSIVINGGTITAQSEYRTAFNKAPTFGSNYSYTVKAGSSSSDARVTTNPTFTEKYIRIEPKTSGGSGGSGGSGDGGNEAPTTDGTAKVEYTVSDGTASLSMSNTKISEIVSKAKNKEAVLDLKSIKNTTAVSIPNNALSSFEKADLDLAVKLPEGNAAIDNKALASILAQSAGTSDMKLELKKISADNLSEAQKEAVKYGDLVFDISILMGTKYITEFDGELIIEVPYDGELPVAVWYLNDKGELEKTDASYRNGTVSFTLNHLSLYVVGKDESLTEDKWINPFVDVKEDNWYYEAARYVYENELMKGTGTNTFSPDGMTTRGMIVTILHRLEVSPTAAANPFKDVAADKYYASAVAWAAENNIVSGCGNDKFGPEDAITREQLAVILINYAKYKGYDISSKADLSKYVDAEYISSWALDAMSWANAKGLIQGDGNSLRPRDNATRAHLAAILYRFVGEIAR